MLADAHEQSELAESALLWALRSGLSLLRLTANPLLPHPTDSCRVSLTHASALIIFTPSPLSHHDTAHTRRLALQLLRRLKPASQ